jgi:holo-[acyl-carrier protein] synthase
MILKGKLGVGVDIENISRFEGLTSIDTFFNKVYTEKELNYCFSKKNPAQHLAVRFAAKEAVIKALGSLNYNNLNLGELNLTEIEISHSKKGVPIVRLHHENFKDLEVRLSLSHCQDKAIAFVIIVGRS